MVQDQALDAPVFGDRSFDAVTVTFGMRNLDSFEAGLSETLREGVFQLLSLIVSLVVLFLLNVPLTLVVLAGVPLVALIYKGMAAGAQKRSLAVQEQTSSLVGPRGGVYVGY